MKFQHILHAVHYEPWLITETAHAAIVQLLEARLGLTATEFMAQRPETGPFGGEPLPVMQITQGIAEIPVFGVLGKGLGQLEKSCGATSIEDVAEDVAEAVNRPDVRGILLNINSPGGTIGGIPEAAAGIHEAAGRKPVVAFTDGTMASAAYWLGSQADAIIATPSARTGSIGVYFPWVDRSKQAEMLGLKVEAITNAGADLKGMGMPGTRLTEAQRAHLEETAEEIVGMFRDDVARKRKTSDETKRGGTMLSAGALRAGLIDEIGDLARARATVIGLAQRRSGQN